MKNLVMEWGDRSRWDEAKGHHMRSRIYHERYQKIWNPRRIMAPRKLCKTEVDEGKRSGGRDEVEGIIIFAINKDIW